jgi:fructokinase
MKRLLQLPKAGDTQKFSLNLEKLMKPRVLCYGEVVIDIIHKGNDMMLLKIGGAPLNVAVGLKRIGIDAVLISSIGDDWFGEMALRYLKLNGIKYYIDTRSGVPTRTTVVFCDSNRERHFEFSPGVAAENFVPLKKLEIAKRLNPDVLYFSSFPFAEFSSFPAFERFVGEMRNRGAVTVFDPNIRLGVFPSPSGARRINRELVALSDVVKLNTEELFFLVGMRNKSTDEREEIERAAACLSKLGPKAIFVTVGSMGSYLFANGVIEFCPSFKVQPVDTIGCGDAFMAAVIAKYLYEARVSACSAHDVLCWANAAGALAATNAGGADSMPTKDEVEKFIKLHQKKGMDLKREGPFKRKSGCRSNRFSTQTKKEDY